MEYVSRLCSIIYLVTLYEKWIQHVNLHKPASIVCEICFKGDYKDPHYCVFMNTVKNGKSCEDFILGDLKPGSYDLTDLMETQKIVSLKDDWKDDSHFFYFMSLLVNIDTLKVAKELRDWVGKEIGPIAKPKEIRFGDNLPKTRSGKIMRRLLRVLAKGEAITQDVSTLENPAILEQLKQAQ